MSSDNNFADVSTECSSRHTPLLMHKPPPSCICSAKSCSGIFIPHISPPPCQMTSHQSKWIPVEERESSDGEENGEDEEADVDELDPFSEDSDSDPE